MYESRSGKLTADVGVVDALLFLHICTYMYEYVYTYVCAHEYLHVPTCEYIYIYNVIFYIYMYKGVNIYIVYI